jgi:hypothetical protein
MKTKFIILQVFIIALFMIATSLFNETMAQTDTTKVSVPDTTVQQQSSEKTKVDRKRRDEFIPFVGVNFNQLSLSSNEKYESSTGLGYHLGFNYKRGKFFYWQVGARFSSSTYSLENINIPDSTDDVSVKEIDIPITGGINFLSAIDRLVALRLFISAVPTFTLGVGDNDLGLAKDDFNSFIMYAQGGIGVNVAFVVIEAGYNYGFGDLLKNYQSTPGQVFINLGFRF